MFFQPINAVSHIKKRIKRPVPPLNILPKLRRVRALEEEMLTGFQCSWTENTLSTRYNSPFLKPIQSGEPAQNCQPLDDSPSWNSMFKPHHLCPTNMRTLPPNSIPHRLNWKLTIGTEIPSYSVLLIYMEDERSRGVLNSFRCLVVEKMGKMFYL